MAIPMAKMHGFYGNSHGKPWHRRAYKPYSCSIEMHGFYNNSHGKPWHRHAYKPYSCSITRKNARILQQFTLQTLAQTCLQTLSVVQSCIEVYGFVTAHITNLGTNTFTLQLGAIQDSPEHGFYGNSHGKPWRRHVYKPYQLFNCA